MNTYLVVFSADPQKSPIHVRHENLVSALKSLEPRNWLLSGPYGFTCLVSIPESIEQIWEKLFTNNLGDFINNDSLNIMAVCKPFEAFGSPKIGDWLEEHLPDEMNPLEDRVR